MSRIPIALQMYTLRDASAADFLGTLEKVAALGYEGVELAGTGGLTAETLKARLDGLGLKVAGSHVGIDQLENDLEAQLDYNQALGNPHVVCPYLPEERRKTAAAYRELAGTLTRVGAKCRERGMQLCYHNHAFEFDVVDGEKGLDILFGASDAGLVKSELDLYWVAYGGEDPVTYIGRLAGRVPLVHLKDMAGDGSRAFAEVGEGSLPWPAIFDAAEKAGASWYIVEQDVCRRDPLESVKISLDNLRKWGKI